MANAFQCNICERFFRGAPLDQFDLGDGVNLLQTTPGVDICPHCVRDNFDTAVGIPVFEAESAGESFTQGWLDLAERGVAMRDAREAEARRTADPDPPDSDEGPTTLPPGEGGGE